MFIIGELINGMYKEVGQAIKNKDKSVIQRFAKEQVNAGCSALDLNCGPASRNPESDMPWLVQAVQEVTDKILCLDSTKPNAIEEGLKIIKNKAMINSTSADKAKLDILVPLALKYKTGLIALTLDKKGVPQDKDRRLELAATIVADCQEKGFSLDELYIDPVVLPVNVAQAQLEATLQVLTEFKIISQPPPKTVVGLSNVSQGAKERSLINRTFLIMAIVSGLDAAILDPLDKELMDSLITAELILNKQIYCDSFLQAYRKK
ncbi:MAG: dihydropteroate synthase [Candidatus Omnitrophota bacterium]|jgi:5-methyltetrahydrofolate corrinoid/iron sulfur protein methyltransferase